MSSFIETVAGLAVWMGPLVAFLAILGWTVHLQMKHKANNKEK